MNVMTRTGSKVASLAALLILSPLGVSGAAADLAKCTKTIGAESGKLVSKIQKSFQGCVDAYRSDKAKGVANFSKAAPKCQTLLDQAVTLPGKSQLQKSHDALAKLPGATCSDADLQQLGHLPVDPFGEHWITAVAVSALQGAYEQELAVVADFPVAMSALAAATGCTGCQALAAPPCFEHPCFLGTVSGGTVHAKPFTIDFSLPGVLTLKLCKVKNLVPENEFAILAAPSRGSPFTIAPGSLFGCNLVLAAEGYMSCGSSSPSASYTTCVDHIVDPAGPSGGSCPETSCQPSQPDFGFGGTTGTPGLGAHPGVTNGGACLKATGEPAVLGGVFINTTTQINLVQQSQLGPDGKPCTTDDTAPPSLPGTVPLTTASASATVLDVDNTPGASLTTPGGITGVPFNCTAAESGDLGGGQIVGALPGLHAAGGNDSATTFVLKCQQQ